MVYPLFKLIKLEFEIWWPIMGKESLKRPLFKEFSLPRTLCPQHTLANFVYFFKKGVVEFESGSVLCHI